MKKIYKSFLLAMIAGLSIFTMGMSNNPPSRAEMTPKYQKMSAKKLQALKNQGEVLTPAIKIKTTKDLIGKSFSFTSPLDGEYFLKLKSDQTFVLVYNDAFKVRTPQEGGDDYMIVEIDAGNYKITKNKIKLFIQDYFSTYKDVDESTILKRINSWPIIPESLTLNSTLYNQLPTDIQQKISPDQIENNYPSKNKVKREFPKKYSDFLIGSGDYILEKKNQNWRVKEPKILLGEGKQKYKTDFNYDGYLHKYDHVYPIPDSVSEDLINKFRASGSY